MKKLFAYVLGFCACAWLINQAVKLLLEVWPVLFWLTVGALAGWFTFQMIKYKEWR